MEKRRTIFDFHDYRQYLIWRLPTSGPERGIRSKLAVCLRCQTAFISRVLHGEADFSLEHAVIINRFLNHTDQETHYFLLLLQRGRAGSKELKDYLSREIDKVLEQRALVVERIQVKQTLGPEAQMTYYSAWYYAAIHICLLVPSLRRPEPIARHLELPLKLTTECLEFLVSEGLAVTEGSEYRPGTSRIHLKANSPMISKHHTNWRINAIQAMDRKTPEDLFFSGPICISESDARRLRDKVLAFIEQAEPLIRESREEAVFCLSFDFFRVGKS